MPAALQDWPGLAAALSRFDDAQLARLLTLRPDLSSPAPRDWSTLASRAGGWPSARDAYRSLDRAGLRVAEALCLLPPPVSLADLATLLEVPADDADLASTLLRLEERALAFRLTGDQIRLLPALRQLDYPGGLGPPLASLLHTLTGPALEQLAVRLGARPAKLMAETRDLIAGILADPHKVGPLIDGAPPGVAELAARAAADGPLVSVPGGLYGFTDRTPAGWMANRGLLGVVDYYTAVMPREPIIALRRGHVFPPGGLRRPGLAPGPVDGVAVDRTAAERAARLVADVASVLDLWSAEPAAVLKAGGMGVREVRRAAKATGRSETDAARIIELAAVAGLARADFGSARALPTEAYDEWLALDTPARWVRLATAWLEAELHLNLAGAIGEKEKPIAPLLHRAPERDARRRRRLVLGVLAEVAPGQAAPAAAVRDRAQWDEPGAWMGGPAAAGTLVYWTLTEAEMLGVAALGALSTAGRALFAGQAQAAVADLAALLPPAVAEFVIQADLTAVIAGEPAPAVRAQLDLMADVESKGAATVYRFSEQSLRQAFDSGRSAADILEFLEGHATRGVPQPLVYLVNDLGRRFGNVRVGAVTTYLRSDDPALLAEVVSARATAKLRLRSIAPTVLVTDADAATVTSTLQAAGYLPAREAADGGLLLAAPAAHRLAPTRFPPRKPAPPPDIPAVVAALRRAPVAPEGPPPAPALTPRPGPSLLDTPRPAEIIKVPRLIRRLLEEACDEYWLVRLGYINDHGRSAELTVEPIEVDTVYLYGTCYPDGDDRQLVVDRIEWVRVLTEAEERLVE
jgi:hypothetical protein